MSWGGRSGRAGLTLLAIFVVVAAIGAPIAAAQTPAGVDQYQPSPPGDEGPTGDGGGNGNGNENPGGGGGGGDEAPTAGGAPSGEVSDGGGGELPFTGYPLTTLVLIILALIFLGLVFRAIAARWRQAPSA